MTAVAPYCSSDAVWDAISALVASISARVQDQIVDEDSVVVLAGLLLPAKDATHGACAVHLVRDGKDQVHLAFTRTDKFVDPGCLALSLPLSAKPDVHTLMRYTEVYHAAARILHQMECDVQRLTHIDAALSCMSLDGIVRDIPLYGSERFVMPESTVTK